MLICVLVVCVAAYATAGYWMPDLIELAKWKAASRPAFIPVAKDIYMYV
jgi:hypothetical protein